MSDSDPDYEPTWDGPTGIEAAADYAYRNFVPDAGEANHLRLCRHEFENITRYIDGRLADPSVAAQPVAVETYTLAKRFFEPSADVTTNPIFAIGLFPHAASFPLIKLLLRFYRHCRVWIELRLLGKWLWYLDGSLKHVDATCKRWPIRLPPGIMEMERADGEPTEAEQVVFDARGSHWLAIYEPVTQAVDARLLLLWSSFLPADIFRTPEWTAVKPHIPEWDEVSDLAREARLTSKEEVSQKVAVRSSMRGEWQKKKKTDLTQHSRFPADMLRRLVRRPFSLDERDLFMRLIQGFDYYSASEDEEFEDDE
jgi:hypothetical protein